MSIQLTKTDLVSLEARLDKRFDNLATIMSHSANDVQSKLAEHDEEFRKINDKYDHLINTIDRFVGRIDT